MWVRSSEAAVGISCGKEIHVGVLPKRGPFQNVGCLLEDVPYVHSCFCLSWQGLYCLCQ